jgi:hypothetical protein
MSFDHLWQHIEDQHPLVWTNSSSSTEFAVLQIGGTTNLVDGWLAKKRCTPDDDDATVHATKEFKDYHHHEKKMVHDSDKGFKPEDCNNTRRKMEMLSEKVDNTTTANNSKLKWRHWARTKSKNNNDDDIMRVVNVVVPMKNQSGGTNEILQRMKAMKQLLEDQSKSIVNKNGVSKHKKQQAEAMQKSFSVQSSQPTVAAPPALKYQCYLCGLRFHHYQT